MKNKLIEIITRQLAPQVRIVISMLATIWAAKALAVTASDVWETDITGTGEYGAYTI